MRFMTSVLSVMVVVLTTAGVAAQTKPSFAGEWKMVTAGAQGEPGVDVVITQDATSMTVDYRRGPAPAPQRLTYALDGSTSRNGTQVTRAAWSGSTIVVVNAIGTGEEKRTFAMDGADLVIETSVSARKGAPPTVSTATYKRYQHGFGG